MLATFGFDSIQLRVSFRRITQFQPAFGRTKVMLANMVSKSIQMQHRVQDAGGRKEWQLPLHRQTNCAGRPAHPVDIACINVA